MTGQPASAFRSTPWGLSGAVLSWLSVIGACLPRCVGWCVWSGASGVSRTGGGAGGAGAPIGHLGLVDDEALGVGGVEAGAVADGAVDVRDRAAAAADDVVVVVADPELVAGHRPGGLDPAHEPRLGQRTEHVVDGLVGHARLLGSDRRQDAAGVGVRVAAYGAQDGETRAGDPQVNAAEQGLELAVVHTR